MLLPLANELPASASILAFGGEDAYYVRPFQRRGHRVTTVTAPPRPDDPNADSNSRPTAAERFIQALVANGAGAAPGYDLILLHRVLHLVDLGLLKDLPRYLRVNGLLYVKTFAADDQMSLEHEFLPIAHLEHALKPLVKLHDRKYWEAELLPRRGFLQHHVIELLFQKT